MNALNDNISSPEGGTIIQLYTGTYSSARLSTGDTHIQTEAISSMTHTTSSTGAQIHPSSGGGNRQVWQRMPEIPGLHTPGLQASAEAFGSLGPQMLLNPGTR